MFLSSLISILFFSIAIWIQQCSPTDITNQIQNNNTHNDENPPLKEKPIDVLEIVCYCLAGAIILA